VGSMKAHFCDILQNLHLSFPFSLNLKLAVFQSPYPSPILSETCHHHESESQTITITAIN